LPDVGPVCRAESEGRERGRDELAVAVVPRVAGIGGPDRVKDGQVVGIGQVAAPGLAGREFGAVAAQDVGQHGDRLTFAGPVWLGIRERCCRVTGSFTPDALIPVELAQSDAISRTLPLAT
jgi:hypothetical protein